MRQRNTCIKKQHGLEQHPFLPLQGRRCLYISFTCRPRKAIACARSLSLALPMSASAVPQGPGTPGPPSSCPEPSARRYVRCWFHPPGTAAPRATPRPRPRRRPDSQRGSGCARCMRSQNLMFPQPFMLLGWYGCPRDARQQQNLPVEGLQTQTCYMSPLPSSAHDRVCRRSTSQNGQPVQRQLSMMFGAHQEALLLSGSNMSTIHCTCPPKAMPFGSWEKPTPVHWKLLLTPDGRCILNSGRSEKTKEWKSPAGDNPA